MNMVPVFFPRSLGKDSSHSIFLIQSQPYTQDYNNPYFM